MTESQIKKRRLRGRFGGASVAGEAVSPAGTSSVIPSRQHTATPMPHAGGSEAACVEDTVPSSTSLRLGPRSGRLDGDGERVEPFRGDAITKGREPLLQRQSPRRERRLREPDIDGREL